MKTCEVCVLIDWESTLEDYPGEKIRADRPLKHINIDALSSSVFEMLKVSNLFGDNCGDQSFLSLTEVIMY